MRWARLFDDLDAQLEAADRAERAAVTADLRRAEVSQVTLSDRLCGAVGSVLTCSFDGGDAVIGELTKVGRDWALVDAPSGGETLMPLTALVSVSGLPAGSSPPADELDRRLGLGAALRRLARDRVVVSVVTRDGAAFTGTIDRVGADFLDLAEHAVDRPRRAAEVQRVRTVAFTAVRLVRAA